MGLCLGLIDAHSGVASGICAGHGRGGGVRSLWVGGGACYTKDGAFRLNIRYSSAHDGSIVGGVLCPVVYGHSGWGV